MPPSNLLKAELTLAGEQGFSRDSLEDSPEQENDLLWDPIRAVEVEVVALFWTQL